MSQLNSLEYIEKIQNMESLLAQKRAYHKQLKSLQQSTYNKHFNKGESCYFDKSRKVLAWKLLNVCSTDSTQL